MTGERSRVVVFTGLPGTGKSTLAEQIATETGTPAFAGDWLMGALEPAHHVLAQLDRPTYLRVWHGLLESLVTRQLMLGQSAIVDAVVDDDRVRQWRRITQSYDAELFVVECVCTDSTVHRRRVEGRVRGIPGWHEVGWDHVQRMRAELAPLTVDRLTVDALEPLPQNLESVRGYLQR